MAANPEGPRPRAAVEAAVTFRERRSAIGTFGPGIRTWEATELGVAETAIAGPSERIVESWTMINTNQRRRPLRAVLASGGHRWMGLSAFAVATFLIIEAVTKLTMGQRPELDDSAALVEYIRGVTTQTFVVILADTFLMAFLIVFLACFQHLVSASRPDLAWVTQVTFGAGLVFVAVTLVGDSMDGGAALDVIGLEPDPSVIRALIIGQSIMFGSTGAVLLALVAATAAYLTFASGVLRRWTAILAAATALSNLALAVLGFGGTSASSVFATGGVGNAILGVFPWLVWVFCVGITTLGGNREELGPDHAHEPPKPDRERDANVPRDDDPNRGVLGSEL